MASSMTVGGASDKETNGRERDADDWLPTARVQKPRQFLANSNYEPTMHSWWYGLCYRRDRPARQGSLMIKLLF